MGLTFTDNTFDVVFFVLFFFCEQYGSDDQLAAHGPNYPLRLTARFQKKHETITLDKT